jgi:hypothetical protein
VLGAVKLWANKRVRRPCWCSSGTRPPSSRRTHEGGARPAR